MPQPERSLPRGQRDVRRVDHRHQVFVPPGVIQSQPWRHDGRRVPWVRPRFVLPRGEHLPGQLPNHILTNADFLDDLLIVELLCFRKMKVRGAAFPPGWTMGAFIQQLSETAITHDDPARAANRSVRRSYV